MLRSRSQSVTLKRGQNIKYLPYAFTEHGAVMAANVLNSERAIAMSVYVVRAFVKLREVLTGTNELSRKLDELERKLAGRLDVHEKAIIELFARIRTLLRPPPPQPEVKRRKIGF
jgi:phage regulator Rha-like protein